MAIVFELAVLFGLIYLVGRIVPPWLRERGRLRVEREAHARRLETLHKTEELLAVLVSDRALAEDVHARLGRLLEASKDAAVKRDDEPG